ncbi:MAG: Lsm family RNA-binding protein [Promethearchaeota archaeon]
MSMMNLKINAAFNKEINTLLNQFVKVELNVADKYYIGELTGYNVGLGSISLSNVTNEKEEKFSKIIIKGDSWSIIYQQEPPFPMEKLSEKIAEIFPSGQVRYQPNSNTINILNGKIIVNENGIQGAGPTAERVHRVFEEFLEEIK